MHYFHFKIHVLHFKKGYFAAEIHYLHFKKHGSEKLLKVKYVKVGAAEKSARRLPLRMRQCAANISGAERPSTSIFDYLCKNILKNNLASAL